MPEPQRSVVTFETAFLQISQSQVTGSSTIDVVERICKATADRVRWSLSEITEPLEFTWLIGEFEKLAGTRFRYEAGAGKEVFAETLFDAQLGNVFAVHKGKPVEVLQRAPDDVPVAAERLAKEMAAWAWMTECYFLLCFAKNKASLTLDNKYCRMRYESGVLTGVSIFLEPFDLSIPLDIEDKPDMAGFGPLMDEPDINQAFDTVVTKAIGLNPELLARVAFRLRREKKAKQGHSLSVVSLPKNSAGKWILAGEDVSAAVEQIVREVTKYANKIAGASFFPLPPRIPMLLPATTTGTEFLLFAANASDKMTRLAMHEVIRGDGALLPDECRRTQGALQQLASDRLARYQLRLLGIALENDKRSLITDRFAAYVGADSNLAGVSFDKNDIGDFDLALFDRQNRRVVIAEVKYRSLARSTREFQTEYGHLGPSGDYQTKHADRVAWVRQLLPQMAIEGWPCLNNWDVQECVLTNVIPKSVLAIHRSLNNIRLVGSRNARRLFLGE